MTRTPDTNTEKLNALYVTRLFLKNKLGLQQETFSRTKRDIHYQAFQTTLDELDVNQAEIDKLLDGDI